MNTENPQVKRLINTRCFRAKRVFRFNISKAFTPRDGSLIFSLINNPPNWVTIDRKSGELSGFTPAVARSRKVLLTVKVENDAGMVLQSFFIKIMAADFIEEYAEKLKLYLSLKNRKRFSDIHAIRHGMLEYLYEVMMHSDDSANFIEQLKQHAKAKQITVDPEEPSVEEFIKVVKAYNKEIESTIINQLNKQYTLVNAELSNIEMRKLFSRGVQPLGAIAAPVWNYLAGMDRHYWGYVLKILDIAEKAIFELRTENLHEFNVTHKP